MAFLRLNNGPNIGKEFELGTDRTLLGRHPSCEVVVQDGSVSRRHALIERRGTAFFIQDMKSRNGTQVNNDEVHGARKLTHGDSIQVCDTRFTFFIHRNHPKRPSEDSDSNTSFGSHSNTRPIEFSDDREQTGNSSIQHTLAPDSSYMPSDGSVSQAKLKALIGITRALSQALELDDVIPRVLQSLFKIFPQADRSFVVLCDEQGELGQRWAADRLNRESSFRVSRRIVSETIAKREAVLIEDALNPEINDPTQSMMVNSMRCVMCAPMLDSRGEKVLGCLQVDTVDPRRKFVKDELELIATVAIQAGISVEMARMHEQTIEQTRVARDLELAKEVQLSLMPASPPNVPGYAFFNHYQPANKVGGDLFDYVELPDEKLGVVVADVAGHGIASALLMARFSAEVRAELGFASGGEQNPAASVGRINRAIIDLNLQRFITMVLLVLDTKNHKLTYVNAGHPSPILRTGNGVEPIGQEVSGLPIGIKGDFEYEQGEIDFEPGATIVLYTDGVNEATNDAGRQFSHDRIVEVVQTSPNDALQIGSNIIREVEAYETPSADNDDTCLVCIQRTE